MRSKHPPNTSSSTLCVCWLGKEGQGKSFFASNLLDWLDFDRILIISPTYESNYAQFKRLGVAQDDIFDPDDPAVVQKVVDIVNAERDDLLEYRQKLAMLKELKANIKNPYDLQENYGLFSEFIGLDGNWITPEHKWGGRKPKLAVFVDDAQSTAIFRNRQFLNLTTRSRHQGSMPGDEASIGISMIIGVQNYTATVRWFAQSSERQRNTHGSVENKEQGRVESRSQRRWLERSSQRNSWKSTSTS